MDTEVNVRKVCFLFCLDLRTIETLEHIFERMVYCHPLQIESVVKKGSLPYHMTMIGGVVLSATEYDQVIQRATEVLISFQDIKRVPIVSGIEILELNGNHLGIRLKFIPGSYVLTGNRDRNKKLISELNPSFSLDSIRHITVCRILGGFKEMDLVKPTFSRLINEHRESLMQMILVPRVWIKDKGVWSLYRR